MIQTDETIDFGFTPSFDDAQFDYNKYDYLRRWNIPNVSLPAPTFANSGLKAAVWVPEPGIKVSTIHEVPVFSVGTEVSAAKIHASDSIWYGGSLPLEILEMKRDINLARIAIENASFGAHNLYDVLRFVSEKLEARYVTLQKN